MVEYVDEAIIDAQDPGTRCEPKSAYCMTLHAERHRSTWRSQAWQLDLVTAHFEIAIASPI